jgi:YegS/Rv2252/BmrU family lipid kinase
MGQALIVLNPEAGDGDSVDVRRTIHDRAERYGWNYAVFEIGGDTSVREAVDQALERGIDTIVAAGGDGTVSSVADGLVNTEARLAILPVGTGNVLARDLGVPPDLDAALDLIIGPHRVRKIDAMQVAHRFAVLNVGVGLSSLMARDTGGKAKERLGVFAYVITVIRKLFGYQPHRFVTVIDGQRREWRASEVMIANCGAVGGPLLRWGPQVRLDDGILDVCIVRAKSAWDYIRLAWSAIWRRQGNSPHLICLPVEDEIRVLAAGSLLVQVDGEVFGATPVRVRIVPGALRVIVPQVAP